MLGIVQLQHKTDKMTNDNFAHRAAEWDNPSKVEMTQKFVQALRSRVDLKASWKGLEIGAGTGLVGLQLLPDLKSVVFEDTSEAMLDVLKQKLSGSENVEILHDEITGYQDSDIDFAFSCMAFHHIANIDTTLAHLYTITKPDATIVIGDLRTEDGSFHRFDPIPHTGFDTDQLSAQFEAHGFKVISTETYNVLERERIPGETNSYEQFMLIATKINK